MNKQLKEKINGTGLRYNSGKTKFHLIPAQIRAELFKLQQYSIDGVISIKGLIALANHYDMAQNIRAKYPTEELNGHKILYNWTKGQNLVGMYLASANRHLYAYIYGEIFDGDLSSHHLIAVAWNLIAFYHQIMNPEYYKEFDDRYWCNFKFNVPAKYDIYDKENAIHYLTTLLPYLESCIEDTSSVLEDIILGILLCLDIYELDMYELEGEKFKLDMTIDETLNTKDYGTANTAK